MNKRPIYTIDINDKYKLIGAYMSFIQNGGIFLPGLSHEMGDDLYLLIRLPEDNIKNPIEAKVVWIQHKTPTTEAGVGVQFKVDEISEYLKNKITSLALGTKDKVSTMTKG